MAVRPFGVTTASKDRVSKHEENRDESMTAITRIVVLEVTMTFYAVTIPGIKFLPRSWHGKTTRREEC